MEVQLFLDEGLGNGSYLLEVAPGEAVLVDPDRRVDRYLARAEALGDRIVAVFDTHLHADFVAGSVETGKRTGATAYMPADADAAFPHRPLSGGDRVTIGEVEVEVLSTPGHAPEHVSYVARSDGDPPILFSGGALIVGGAARSDLVSADLTDELTRAEFRTLRSAFIELPDETALLPTHGGGSFCSAGGGAGQTSTLAAERATNPLLAIEDEESFVDWWPTTFPSIPAYFARMRGVNRAGPRPRSEIEGPPMLDPEPFATAVSAGGLIVDCRPPDAYAAAHIEGSLAIPFRDAFPTWLGWLAPVDAPLLLVTDGLALDEVVDACLLVGYERFAGNLRGGVDAWQDDGLPVRSLPTIGPEDAVPWLEMGAQPVDVREPDEFALGSIAGAVLAPLGSLPNMIGKLPSERPLLTYCAAGMRSVTGASVLERMGVGPVVNLRGGYGAWRSAHRD